MTISGEDKLIVLTNNLTLNAQRAAQWPLSQLPFYFHIAPQTISEDKSYEHAEQAVIRRGSVSQFGGASLKVWSWDGEWMDEDWVEVDGMPRHVINPPAGMRFYGAHASNKILDAIGANGLVVNLSIQDQQTGRLEVFSPVTLRSLPKREEGGEPDVRFYSITLTEYRFLRIRNVPRAGAPTTSAGRPTIPLYRYVPDPWTVPAEMGIKTVSLRAYHNMSHWDDIVRANNGAKGMRAKGCTYDLTRKDGPWVCPKGIRLRIPAINISGAQPR